MGYILCGKIQEYDINSANISVFMDAGVISQKEYNYYNTLPKLNRNIQIGLRMRDDRSLIKVRDEQLKKYTNLFVKENGIGEELVIEVASDAVWFYDHFKPIQNKFGDWVVFKKDRSATILLAVGRVKFYWNSLTGERFTRGFRGETDFQNRVYGILAAIEGGANKSILYNTIHDLKRDIYSGVSDIPELNTKELVDEIIDVLDENNYI